MQALAQRNTDLRQALITDHVDLALKIARHMSYRLPASVSREDVDSAALLGLTEAASRYDASRNEPFMAFAKKRIRGAVVDHLRRIDHLSRRSRQEARRVRDAARRLEAELGRSVSEREVAEDMGISVDSVRSAYRSLRAATTVRLDDSDEAIIGMHFETATEVVERQQRRTALLRALEGLERRSLMIIALHYQEGLTLSEIGEVLGVTESRVCQLRTQALRELRSKLA